MEHGQRLTIPELVERSGASLETASATLGHFTSSGLVREVRGGTGESGYHLGCHDLLAAGIEIADGQLNGVIVDLYGRVRAEHSIALQDAQLKTVTSATCELLELLCDETGGAVENLLLLAVALPGIVSTDGREVVLSRPLDWSNVPIVDSLEQSLPIAGRIGLVNNAAAGATAEFFDHHNGNAKTMFYVLLYLERMGRAELANMGCGIILDGRTYLGDRNMAGEVRAQVDHPLGIALQTLGNEAPTTLTELIGESLAGNRFAAIWDQFADQLGAIVAHGVDLLSPGSVVIGTDCPQLAALIEDPLEYYVGEHTISGLTVNICRDSIAPNMSIVFRELMPSTLARGAVVSTFDVEALGAIISSSRDK